MRSCWALNPMTGVLRRQEKTRRVRVLLQQTLAGRRQGHQELDEAGGSPPFPASLEELPLAGTSRTESTHPCGVKLPSLWSPDVAAPGH